MNYIIKHLHFIHIAHTVHLCDPYLSRKKYDIFLRNYLKNRTSYQKIQAQFPLQSYVNSCGLTLFLNRLDP
jgi:hypothetical protein